MGMPAMGFHGAHSQGATLDELNHNLLEVVELLLEDGEPELSPGFDEKA
jgi:predicted RNase H-like HicB family nuclease